MARNYTQLNIACCKVLVFLHRAFEFKYIEVALRNIFSIGLFFFHILFQQQACCLPQNFLIFYFMAKCDVVERDLGGLK